MTIKGGGATAGNVGIGTTSPATKLDVAGTARVSDGGETCSSTVKGGIRYTSANALQYCNASSWQTLSSSGTPAGSNAQIQFNSAGAFGAVSGLTWVISGSNKGLNVTGNINYSGLLVSTSDRRVKENIKPLDATQLDLITRLEPVSYNKIGSQDREYGFIAQDVDPIYPDLVGIRPDGIRTMNYMGLISPMVEAIKQQQQEILFLRYMTALALVFGLGGLSGAVLLWRRR